MVASLLTHREIHFSNPSGRIWSEDPFTGWCDDVTMEVMIPVGCESTHRDTTLGHLIRGWVGASSVEHWFVDGYGDTWGSASHHIEYMRRVTGAVTHDVTGWHSHSRGYPTVYRGRS